MSKSDNTLNPDGNETADGRIRLLVIDDDRKLCRLIQDYLEPMGYDVSCAHTGVEGLERAVNESWQAVLLDVMLPGMNGFELLKQLRQKSNVPVLMLTARGEEADRIVGLEMGADDYLPKTFSTRELLARLRAVVRRAAPAAVNPGDEAPAEIVVGQLRLNPGARVALMKDQPLVLTPVEYEILLALARAKGRVKSREQLIDQVRERDYDVFDRSIDVHISSLRRKLGDDSKAPQIIRTIRAVGYMLVDPRQADALES
jgi:DNA-binding response OmpR family regulator